MKRNIYKPAKNQGCLRTEYTSTNNNRFGEEHEVLNSAWDFPTCRGKKLQLGSMELSNILHFPANASTKIGHWNFKLKFQLRFISDMIPLEVPIH